MQPRSWPILLTSVAHLFAWCAVVPACIAAPPAKSPIEWRVASTDLEVDKAFELARQTGKPVFLYWGAVWCPPCNQVQATLFARPDFVERTRAFVPVYVDGDRPGAQKIASRFKVEGYPTMVLFKPDATEVTRLPGEVDPERYMLTLSAAMEAQVPVRQLVQLAISGQKLSPAQWRLLAYYAWDTDQQQVVKSANLPATLSLLSKAVPSDQPQLRERLALKAILAHASDERKLGKASMDDDLAAVERLLASKAPSSDLSDLFIYFADPVVRYVGDSAESRAKLASRWDSVISTLLASGGMSRTQRADALDSRVDLWKFIDRSEELSPQRQQVIRHELNKLVLETTDRYERQSVVPTAAHVLRSSGLLDESDALLKAELPRAVAPYYHMLVLGGNAKKRGDKAAALRWYEEAWRKSEGPATRIQWGGTYVREAIALAPEDTKRVASAATAVIAGLEPRGETFFERNQTSLQLMAKQLADWSAQYPYRKRVFAKLEAQLAKTCGKLPPGDLGRSNCENVFAAKK